MSLRLSPAAIRLFLKGKATPVEKVRFLIYEISELDKVTCTFREKVKSSMNQIISELEEHSPKELITQIHQDLIGY